MKKIKSKKIFKHFDYFGVNLTFHYKGVDKYRSSTGGLIFLFFIVLAIVYIIIMLPSFLKKKNMKLIFYEKTVDKTDNFSLVNYSSNMSFLFSCENIDKELLLSYFSIELTYTTNKFDFNSNERKKTKTQINYHNCTKSDFYNEFNETFDTNNFSNAFCFTDIGYFITGIYTDNEFNYFEISIKSKKNANETEIKKILHQNECLFNIFYIDTSIDVNDFNFPVKKFINNKFLNLNFNSVNKMNFYFKTIIFESFENLLFDKGSRSYYLGFSNSDSYENEKGENRFKEEYNDYNLFAKIYVRAGLTQTLIQRQYQKLTEFLANVTSLFSSILMFLFFLITNLNKFYCRESIMKRIFQFQDNKRSKSYNSIRLLKHKINFEKIKENTVINRNKLNLDDNSFNSENKNNCDEIKNIIYNSDIKYKNQNFQSEIINGFNDKSFVKSNFIKNKIKKYETEFHKKKGINFNNGMSDLNIENIENNNNNNKSKFEENKNENKKTKIDFCENMKNNNNNNNKEENSNLIFIDENQFTPKKIKSNNKNKIKNNKNFKQKITFNNIDNNNVHFNNFINNKNLNNNYISLKNTNDLKTNRKLFDPIPPLNSLSLQNSANNIKSLNTFKEFNKNKNFKNNFDLTLPFRIYELFLLFLCPCFGSKKIKLKKKLFYTGQKRFYFQLDILTYLEKIQQIEIIHNILFNNKEKKMIRFLSKPAISLNNEDNDFKKISDKQYHPYNNQSQIDEIFKYYQYLDKKICKNNYEEKLYILAKLHIEKLLNM